MNPPLLCRLLFAAALICLAGCGPASQSPAATRQTPAAPAGGPSAQSAAEGAVMEAAAKILNVRRGQIPLDIPLGKPPLNADELDVVEIVIEVEERLGIEIPDADLEREAGSANATQLAQRLTPAMLVRLAGLAKREPASTQP